MCLTFLGHKILQLHGQLKYCNENPVQYNQSNLKCNGQNFSIIGSFKNSIMALLINLVNKLGKRVIKLLIMKFLVAILPLWIIFEVEPINIHCIPLIFRSFGITEWDL